MKNIVIIGCGKGIGLATAKILSNKTELSEFPERKILN